MATTTNRILEFSPSQEEAVVSRVLVLVHEAVDENFPGVEQAGRQFTKTVFSAEGESTLSHAQAATFGSDEATSPGGRPSVDAGASHLVPPPPPQLPIRGPESAPPARPPEQEAPPAQMGVRPSPAGMNTGGGAVAMRTGQVPETHGSGTLEEGESFDGVRDPADWPMRIMLALFIAGVIVLGYALLI